jgi:glycosyltransferase involved in cell wall biosynthesis
MLSIAMATYNGEKYIREQIDSILKQTYQDFELIICDDCSTDNTIKIIQEFCCNDVRIHIYKNEKRLGYIKNFEKALCLCRGDYIALSDQDDIWEHNHLELLYKNIEENLLICSNALLVDANNISLNSTMKDIIHIKYIPSDRQLIFQRLLYMNFVQGSSILISRELLDRAIPFPPEIPHDYWLAIIAASKSKLIYGDFITLRYRQHTYNVTVNRKVPSLKSFLSRSTFNQSNVLHVIYTRLTLKKDFKILLDEAILLYAEDQKSISKIKKIIRMFSIYRIVNFNKSIVLLLYRIFRFTFLKMVEW